MDEMEVDVAECSFTVWENGEAIWNGGSYEHAFFLKAVDPKTRKVTIKAKVDVALEGMEDFVQSMKEPE